MGNSVSTDYLLHSIRDGEKLSFRHQLYLSVKLSFPAIVAQLSTIVMQYIDASMVGNLGAKEAASIGIVMTTLWLFGGLCSAFATGFHVQVAHLLGAKQGSEAKNVLRQGIVMCLCAGLLLSAVGAIISPFLPLWLGGDTSISHDASVYFLVFSLCIPFIILNSLASGMLRSSGNMRIPSMLNILMCILDVMFNYFLIFPEHTFSIGSFSITISGADLGVLGAALGTSIAEVLVCGLLLYYLIFRSKDLSLRREKGSFRPTRRCLSKAVSIAVPMGLQQCIMSVAYIFTTVLVAPLGNMSIAANNLAVTAESLCYMPGFGIADAATTLVGQCLGAGRRFLAKRFAAITVVLGMTIMGVMGIIIYVTSPYMMQFMCQDVNVVALGSEVLRIEAFAEPLYAASIVAYGIFVGAGDTKAPCFMTVASMWGVRLTLAYLFINTFSMGLQGMWLAMCIELCCRGLLFLYRLSRLKWLDASRIVE